MTSKTSDGPPSSGFLRRIGRRAVRMLTHRWIRARVGVHWDQQPDDGFMRRSYRSYDDYILHQRAKLDTLDLPDYDVKFRQVLRERVASAALLPDHASVLCLAARIGTEVKAFIDLGHFAVGIDLNPGKANRYVLTGDFHDLQFANEALDAVFTNSLDHAFDVAKIVAETRRVLKPGGYFIVEAIPGLAANKKPRFFEAFWWSTIDDLVKIFEKDGFQLALRRPFEFPWPGEQLWLRRI